MALLFLFWGGGDRVIKKTWTMEFFALFEFFMNLEEHTYAEYSDFLQLPKILCLQLKLPLHLLFLTTAEF